MEEQGDEGIGALDQLYAIVEMLDGVVSDLENTERRRVDVWQYPGILEAVSFLDELGMSNRLGLSSMDLDKFQRMSGTIDSSVLLRLLARLRSLLREAEGIIREVAAGPSSAVPQTRSPPRPEGAVRVTAVEWVRNDRDKNAELIGDLTELLDDAVARARGTNLPPGKAALTDFQRRALIELLETAMQMLKAPLIERGLLRKLGAAAGEGAFAAVKKGAEVGLGVALKRLGELLAQFLNGL